MSARAFLLGWTCAWAAAVALLVIVDVLSGMGQRETQWPTVDGEPVFV